MPALYRALEWGNWQQVQEALSTVWEQLPLVHHCYTLLYIGIEEHPSMQQKNWAEFFTGVNAPNAINWDSDLSNQGMTQNA